MSSTKLAVTILGIPGSTRRKVGVVKIPYVLTKQDLSSVKLPEKERNKIAKKGWYKIPKYEYVSCSQRINMTEEAYDYFVSNAKPEWYLKKDWGRLNKKQRLECHLERTMQQFNGTSFTYSIIDD